MSGYGSIINNVSNGNGINGIHYANGCARIVDLRSDTVTKPTAAMREAMASAEVDDDVLGGDPTVIKLQQQLASLCGKEDALFVASGTMGNLISVMVHCEVRGSEVIIGSQSHIHLYEQGGISTIGGVYPHLVPNEKDGTLNLENVEAAIRSNDIHSPRSQLICIENTHANSGGKCITPEYTANIAALARKHGLKLHIDGARIFNAATALKVPVGELVKPADSVSICLSKGLGAPVGSVIVGSHEFIDKARRLRKALGGGMRQLGVLAAPALVSLSDIACKLHLDHENARLLADGVNKLKGLHVDPTSIETNMVFMDVTEQCRLSVAEIILSLRKKGILLMDLHGDRIRAVTHHQISRDDIEYTIQSFKEVIGGSAIANGCS